MEGEIIMTYNFKIQQDKRNIWCTGIVEKPDECELDDTLIIPEGVTKIAMRAFKNYPFSSVIIPNSVKWIGDSAFEGCEDLEELIGCDGVLRLETKAFEKTRIYEAKFSSLRHLTGGAFNWDNALERIIIPKECKVEVSGPRFEAAAYADDFEIVRI